MLMADNKWWLGGWVEVFKGYILSWNPSWRSSAQEALKHSYFRQNSQVLLDKDADLIHHCLLHHL